MANRLYVIRELLQLRRDDPELFAQGEYQALPVDGAYKEHVLAFARTYQNRSCIVIVPRWTAKLMHGATDLPLGARVWGDTKIAVGSAARTTDVLTGRQVTIGSERTLSVADVFAEFPVAVLVGQASA